MMKLAIMKNNILHLTADFISPYPATWLAGKRPIPHPFGYKLKRRLQWGLTAGLVLLATGPLAAQTPAPEEGFVGLFDGKTLDGWKVGDNAELFHVEDGMIVMDCPAMITAPPTCSMREKSTGHAFTNFDLRVDVMTYPCANSGIYFHTEFQNAGFPRRGLSARWTIAIWIGAARAVSMPCSI